MLVNLFGENFRSFRDHFELSMVAADLKNEKNKNRGIVSVELEGTDEPLNLLRTAAIFGPNASGKSSLLMAASALNWIIEDSSPKSKPERKLPVYDPFQLNQYSDSEPVHLGCTVTFGKKLLKYEVKYTSTQFLFESLIEFGIEEKIVFERNKEQKVVGELIESNDSNKLYVNEMQPNVSVLSKLAQHGPSQGEGSVVKYYEVLLSTLNHHNYAGSMPRGKRLFDPIAERFHEDSEFRNWVMANLISTSDVGIVDVQTDSEELPEEVKNKLSDLTDDVFPDNTVDLSFVHAGDAKKKIDLIDESEGTRKIYRLSSDWWDLAHQEITLIADELSASLHPRLFESLVRAVSSPENMKQKSQLIFTTHDVGLLEGRDGLPPALRRDQVYFTQKESDGSSSLYSLAEFKDQARDVHNLRKRYLEGRYGALPMPEGIKL